MKKTNVIYSWMKRAAAVLVSLIMAAGAVSCSDNDGGGDGGDGGGEVKEKVFASKEYGDNEWKYFSFSKNDFVTVTDPANDLSWDLAFQRYYVRTNSGLSGKGKGGAIDTGVSSMESVAAVPSGTFLTDGEVDIISGPGMPPVTKKSTGNMAFSISSTGMGGTVSKSFGWATYAYMEGVWKYNNNVIAVRTADGNYAKVKMVSYTDEEDKSGTVTFQYVYPL